jgi:hypothetical protein
MTGWGRGITAKPESAEERAERLRLARAKRQAELKKLDRKGKVRVLAKAVAAAAVSREVVSIEDLTQAGFGEHEARELFPEAIAIARRLEPTMLTARVA